MTTPLFLALGGPQPSYVTQHLAAVLPGYSGFTTGITAGDVFSNDFGDLDKWVAMLADGQVLNIGVDVTADDSPDYPTVSVMDTLGHGPTPQAIKPAVPFGDLIVGDKIDATKQVCEHLLEQFGVRPNMIGTGVGSATSELRYWWGPQGLAQYQALYPGKTLDDLKQMAIAARVTIARACAPLVAPGGFLRSTYLDPGTLGGDHDDGAYAISDAQAICDMLAAEFPGVGHVVVYESLQAGRAVPPLYGKMPGRMGYQAREGAVVQAWPDGSLFGENHIRDVVGAAP